MASRSDLAPGTIRVHSWTSLKGADAPARLAGSH
jgi:hypothetical protein